MDQFQFFLENFPIFFEKWLSAITNPGQFLSKSFAPTDQQLADALKFYVVVASVSLLIYGLITFFAERGSLAIKARMLATSLLVIIFFFVGAMAAHIPMWLLGGKGSFSGTLLAYIYAAVPYAPLVAIATWIQVAGMPPRFRRYAFDPAAAQKLGPIVAKDPETDKITFFIGFLILVGLIVWSLFLVIRWLSFVHDLGGWRFTVAVVFLFVISYPIGRISQRMTSMINGEPEMADGAGDSAGGDT
jgi:hypothetical protein